MQRLDKKSVVLGIASTILIGVASFLSVYKYTPSIFVHMQFPTSLWGIMAFLFCIPSVIATIGMTLRKMWSLPLAAFLTVYLSVLSTRYLIINLQISALYPKDIAFIVAVIVLYFSLFLVLAFNSGVKQYFNFKSGIQGAKKYIHKHRFSFASCLLILVMVEIYCVKQYLYFQQYPWPPPEIANQEIHKKWPFFVKGNLQNEDIEIIVGIINGLEKIDKNILYVILKEDGTVTVYTGELIEPLWGGGDEIRLRKVDNVWKIIEQGTWLTKNELPNKSIHQTARSAAALTRLV